MRTQRRLALGLGSMALVAALAPAPRASDEPEAVKKMAESKAALARQIADFFADPRLAAIAKNGEERGIPGTDNVESWTRRYIDARLDAATGKDDRIKILQEDVDRTRAIEARIKALAGDAPGFGKLDAFKAEYYRVDAEYRLAGEKDGR